MLNEIQIRVLNSLMDSDENVEEIKNILKNIDKYIVDDAQIIQTLLFLFENKYIACILPQYDEKEKRYFPYEISSPDITKMQDYWFKLLSKGRIEVNKECYNPYFSE